jgi:CHAT domain-containing protein/tetratricopeptide (TPR) repeat protein
MKPARIITICFCLALGLASPISSQDNISAVAEGLLREAIDLLQQSAPEAALQANGKAESALRLYRKIGDRSGEAFSLLLLGKSFNKLQEKQKASEYYNQAATLYRSIGDPGGEAIALNDLGLIRAAEGEPQKALDCYTRALPLYRAAKDIRGEATALNNIGLVYIDMGELQVALNYYTPALDLYRKAKDKAGEATALNSIAGVYALRGEQRKALEYYNQSLPLRRAVGDKIGEAATLHNIGRLYADLGEHQKALEHYAQVLPLCRLLRNKAKEATTLTSIGAVVASLGDQKEALDFYNRALPLAREARDRGAEAATLAGIGGAYLALDDHSKALEYYTLSLNISRELGDRRGESVRLTNIGLAQFALGQQQKALEHFARALPLSHAVENRSGEAVILGNLTYVLNDLKQRRAAIGYGKLSVNLFQQLRGDIRALDRAAQQSFHRSHEGAYGLLAELLIEEGRLPEAHQTLNFAKDQGFYDQSVKAVGKNSPSVRLLALTPLEREAQRKMLAALDRITPIGQQLTQLQARLNTRRPSPPEAAQLTTLNAALEAEMTAFQKLLRQLTSEFESPAQDADRLATIEDTAEMQQTLRELNQRAGAKAVSIYTLVGRDSCRTLLITADRITTAKARINAREFGQKTLKLLRVMRNPRYDPHPLAREMYDALFKPIESEVNEAGATLLMWSLDGSLRYLPMGALWDGQRYLAERYQHAVFTRASPERLLAEVSRDWTGLGFGSAKAHTVKQGEQQIPFGALCGVPRELGLIFGNRAPRAKGVLNGPVLLDEQFTRLSFLSALKRQARKPVIHIASHFSFRPGEDDASFLLLGNGDTFSLADFKQEAGLFNGVELLALSACSTAAQQANAFGREIDGFAELAQRLGANAVMASLWEVADGSTAVMMEDFYHQRQSKAGMTKAAALQEAQLALLTGKNIGADQTRCGRRTSEPLDTPLEKDAPIYTVDRKKPYAHPYYWAPFILIGNWR